MGKNNDAQLAKLRRLQALRRDCGLFFYRPYPKQAEFHDLSATKRERLLMAGNRLGKTFAAGNEVAWHVTGLYPEWYKGRRFQRQTRGWVGSVTAELTRDGAQRILLGPVGQWGTGTIPKELIVDIKRARGIPDAVETILIKHVHGGISSIGFKAYSDGREAWQAEELDWVWYDEEPPLPVYIEGMTRTNNTGGPVFLTFTPLLGMSDVVLRFLEAPHPDRAVINMTIDDVEHYSPELKAQIIAQYPEHEREARAMGIPMLGSGRIFPVAEEIIREQPIAVIPEHWKQIIGLDFGGWDHPTAAVRLLIDEATDCIHVAAAYKQNKQIPVVHIASIRPWGRWIPVAWPRDGLQHDKGSMVELAHQFGGPDGLRMLPEWATFPDDRGVGVEAGLIEMLQRMQTGRFKVGADLSQWFDEYRMYHRVDGKVVKQRDDLLDATRYGIMMRRCALPWEDTPPPPDRYARKQQRLGSAGRTWMSG